MELDDATYRRVTDLSEAGNRHMDRGEWAPAIVEFEKALAMLPEPRQQWEAAQWLYASIGDAQFSDGQYEPARNSFLDAARCGPANPFIDLRLGESCFELGDLSRAREHLLRAYMMEGREIFAEEPPKYLDFLAHHGDLVDPAS